MLDAFVILCATEDVCGEACAENRRQLADRFARDKRVAVPDKVPVKVFVNRMNCIGQSDTTSKPVDTVSSRNVFDVVGEVMSERRKKAARRFRGLIARSWGILLCWIRIGLYRSRRRFISGGDVLRIRAWHNEQDDGNDDEEQQSHHTTVPVTVRHYPQEHMNDS